MAKRILLTSVFGPFGVDDPWGRKENIMELFHNQVTKAREMARLVRAIQPGAEISLGGHGAAIEGVEGLIACDHVVKGKGGLLVPGVGCVNGCPFCATSHFFGKAYTPFF
jgi:hypothetical protein